MLEEHQQSDLGDDRRHGQRHRHTQRVQRRTPRAVRECLEATAFLVRGDVRED
jgi:hypothetical protein